MLRVVESQIQVRLRAEARAIVNLWLISPKRLVNFLKEKV